MFLVAYVGYLFLLPFACHVCFIVFVGFIILLCLMGGLV